MRCMFREGSGEDGSQRTRCPGDGEGRAWSSGREGPGQVCGALGGAELGPEPTPRQTQVPVLTSY